MPQKRIMIVEDEALVALEMESHLKEMGYGVTARVNSGSRAVEKAAAVPPDLILMDINLNGEIDGIEAALQIRKHLDIPVVFVTAYAEEEKLERAKLTLPYGYLLKPIQERELKTTISMAFYTHQVDTERKKAEMERRELEQKLFEAHKMESLGTLAGGIAHDFNNILQPIMVYADMIHKKAEPESKISIFSNRIITASERARKLVEQILTFSQVSEPDFRPMKLQSVVYEVMAFIGASIPSNIEVRLNIDENCGYVRGDVTQIHQIIMNLVINAHHAMQNQSGRLDIDLEAVNADTHSDAGESSPVPLARLSIADTGDGMEPEILDRIFDPYFTTKDKGKGTGLGLSVVRGIVESHGGSISVSSQPGAGSRFDLLFPIIEVRLKNDSLISTPGDARGTERILLIDDEDPVLQVEREILEPLGYHVSTVSSGMNGLETFRANPHEFDLVITDLIMPDITGDLLTKELLNIRSDLPVIICTGFGERTNGEDIKASGAKKLLFKPVTHHDLTESVRSVLNGI